MEGGKKEIPGSLYYLCVHITSTVEPADRFSWIFFINIIIPLYGTNPAYTLNNKTMDIQIIGGGRGGGNTPTYLNPELLY